MSDLTTKLFESDEANTLTNEAAREIEKLQALTEQQAEKNVELEADLKEIFKAWQECYSKYERPALFARVEQLLSQQIKDKENSDE